MMAKPKSNKEKHPLIKQGSISSSQALLTSPLANEQSCDPSTTSRSWIRLPNWFLLAVGWLSVGLGLLGIPLPVLPTTPFLLLAAACFLRSSPRAYRWLTEHPRLGPYVVSFLNGRGMPLKAKVYTLILMWASMVTTLLLVAPDRNFLFGLLPLIGLLVSRYIWRLPTLKG